MKTDNNSNRFIHLQTQISGEVFTDNTTRILYATDASAYKVMPLAVIYPKSEEDIQKLIEFANQEKLSLIPLNIFLMCLIKIPIIRILCTGPAPLPRSLITANLEFILSSFLAKR